MHSNLLAVFSVAVVVVVAGDEAVAAVGVDEFVPVGLVGVVILPDDCKLDELAMHSTIFQSDLASFVMIFAAWRPIQPPNQGAQL